MTHTGKIRPKFLFYIVSMSLEAVFREDQNRHTIFVDSRSTIHQVGVTLAS